MAGQQVVISVLADTKQFASGMSGAGKQASGFTSSLKKIGIGAGVALAAATAAVAGFVSGSIEAAGAAQVVAAQTEAVLASTSSAAQRTAAEISGLAGELSRLSGVDDEAIQSGQNLLLTFTKIRGANFDAATQSALDLSVAMGTDMTSAATLVGKALNDPIKGISSLSRVGVQLTADQKALIQQLVATGDVAGAQAVILAELNTQFGGSAEAFGNTYEGAVGKVQTAFGNLQESIGGAFLPIVTTVLGKISELLDGIASSPAFESFLTGLSAFLAGLLSGEGALGGFAAQLAPLLGFLSPLGVVLKVLQPLLPTLVDGLAQVGSTVSGALASALPTVTGMLNTLVSILSGALAAILPTLIPLVVKLAEVLGTVLAAVLPVAGTLLESVASILVALLPVVLPIIDAVLGVVSAFLPLVGLLVELAGAILQPLIELLTAILVPILGLIEPLIGLLAPALQFVAEVLSAVIGWVVQAITFFVKLITGSEEAKAGIQRVWQGILDFFAGIPNAIGDFFSGAAKWLVQAGRDIVNGLLDGLKKSIGAVWDWISDIGKGIADTFANILGIHSPSRVFRDLGRFVISGLETGLAAPNQLNRIMAGLSEQVAGGFSADLDVPAGYRSALAGDTYHITVPSLVPTAETGRVIVTSLEEYKRVGGRQ